SKGLKVLCGSIGGSRFNATYEFCIFAQIFQHSRMFAPDRAIDNINSDSLRNASCRPYFNCAVDNCHLRPEQINVAGRLTDEITYLKREADMQNVDVSNLLTWR